MAGLTAVWIQLAENLIQMWINALNFLPPPPE